MRYILLATWVYVNGSTGTAVSTQFSELHYSLEACDQERRLLAKMGIFARCKPESQELHQPAEKPPQKARQRPRMYFSPVVPRNTKYVSSAFLEAVELKSAGMP